MRLDKLEYAEVRGTRLEVRSIKSGRLRPQVFSIDNKWRAARLAELSLRTSHLVLRTFVGTTNINLSLICYNPGGLMKRHSFISGFCNLWDTRALKSAKQDFELVRAGVDSV